MIVQRFEQLTGKPATLAETGASFETTAALRSPPELAAASTEAE